MPLTALCFIQKAVRPRLTLAMSLMGGLMIWACGGEETTTSPGGQQQPPTVNSADDVDDGTCNATHCSLREALSLANAHPRTDTIGFNIPGAGPHSIQPNSALPTITTPVVVDGYTQRGASPNTNGPELGSNAVLKIELDGTNAGGTASGLWVTAGGSTLRGLVINRFSSSGIRLEPNGGNLIEGNFIGTDVTGTADLGNLGHGMLVERSPDNTIGGTVPQARNVISGNEAFGIFIGFFSTENFVQGNFIGTDVTGTVDLGNTQVGLNTSSSNTTIGGTAAGARNVVSGNGAHGIQLSGVGSGVTGTVVQGNFIGTDVTGTLALGNAFSGVAIFGNANTTIGGATSGTGNVLSGNSDGILISGAQETLVQGNFIGTDVTGTLDLGNRESGVYITNATDNTIGGTTAGGSNVISHHFTGVLILSSSSTGNLVQGNSIFANTGLGIDLDPPGLTANDAGDGDTGANNLQNFPVFTSATSSSGSISIAGDLNSTATTNFSLQFYANATCDASGNGEGETFLGSTMVTTDGSGNTGFTVTLTATVAVGQFITATATDPTNNTSEFSQCMTVS